MAAPSRSSDCEVATCMNEARRINIYCDADCEALTDVIMDYFTTGHPSDTEDEVQYDNSDNEVGLTKCVSVDNVSVDGSDINEGTNCDFVYCTVSRLLYKQLKHLFNLISIQLF